MFRLFEYGIKTCEMKLRNDVLLTCILVGLGFNAVALAQPPQVYRPGATNEETSDSLHSLTSTMEAMQMHYLDIVRKSNPSVFNDPKRKTPEAKLLFESEITYFMAAQNAALTLGNLVGSIERYQKHNGAVSRFVVNQDDRSDSRVLFHDPRRITACNSEIISAAENFERAHERLLRDGPQSRMIFNFAPLYETIVAAAERAKKAPGKLAFEPTKSDQMTLETAAGRTGMGFDPDHVIIRHMFARPLALLHLYGSYAITHGFPEYETEYKDHTRDLTAYIAASCLSPAKAMEYRVKHKQALQVMHREIEKAFKSGER